jgi:hypothetical protein
LVAPLVLEAKNLEFIFGVLWSIEEESYIFLCLPEIINSLGCTLIYLWFCWWLFSLTALFIPSLAPKWATSGLKTLSYFPLIKFGGVMSDY